MSPGSQFEFELFDQILVTGRKLTSPLGSGKRGLWLLELRIVNPSDSRVVWKRKIAILWHVRDTRDRPGLASCERLEPSLSGTERHVSRRLADLAQADGIALSRMEERKWLRI
jgi:hypothetical protein